MLDNSGIILQYNLSDYLPNYVVASPFTVIASFPLTPYTSIWMYPMDASKMTTYNCFITDRTIYSNPLTQYYN
jgi:hypothetical protein